MLYVGGERALEEEPVQTESTSSEKVIEDACTKFFVGTEVHRYSSDGCTCTYTCILYSICGQHCVHTHIQLVHTS